MFTICFFIAGLMVGWGIGGIFYVYQKQKHDLNDSVDFIRWYHICVLHGDIVLGNNGAKIDGEVYSFEELYEKYKEISK